MTPQFKTKSQSDVGVNVSDKNRRDLLKSILIH